MMMMMVMIYLGLFAKISKPAIKMKPMMTCQSLGMRHEHNDKTVERRVIKWTMMTNLDLEITTLLLRIQIQTRMITMMMTLVIWALSVWTMVTVFI